MRRITILSTGLSVVTAVALVPFSAVADTDTAPEPAKQKSWTIPTAESVDSAITSWLADTAETPEQASQWQGKARPLLDQLYTSADRLDTIADCIALQLPEAKQLIEKCHRQVTQTGTLDWLESADVPYWIRNNLRLLVGRALVRSQYHEQALEVLEGITTQDVFDPASLLFFRSIAEHQLVMTEEAKATLASLLEAQQPLPERFIQVARLMQADIAKVEQDSLDHIARRMNDVERRLSLGETNQRAQDVELGIIESLDKLIDKLEKQQQQQQQQAGSQPSGQPMEESRIAEMKGPGRVDPKNVGDGSGWGDLPPRERERVMQQIGRDFPGHYRDLMEEYLKRLATDEREDAQP